MDIFHACRVLGRQGGGGCHGIAAVGGESTLICFETAVGLLAVS